MELAEYGRADNAEPRISFRCVTYVAGALVII